jgi:N-acetyl-anhydromuramyl-L-alanine amidase AmpD
MNIFNFTAVKRKIDLIVIHCAATGNGKSFFAADIDQWHRARGWDCIGYHYVIPLNGLIEHGRALEKVGAHARGYNQKSIGICLIGTDQFTLAQWQSLRELVTEIISQIEPITICGHRDLPNVSKVCPGFDVASWLDNDMHAPAEHVLQSEMD